MPAIGYAPAQKPAPLFQHEGELTLAASVTPRLPSTTDDGGFQGEISGAVALPANLLVLLTGSGGVFSGYDQSGGYGRAADEEAEADDGYSFSTFGGAAGAYGLLGAPWTAEALVGVDVGRHKSRGTRGPNTFWGGSDAAPFQYQARTTSVYGQFNLGYRYADGFEQAFTLRLVDEHRYGVRATLAELPTFDTRRLLLEPQILARKPIGDGLSLSASGGISLPISGHDLPYIARRTYYAGFGLSYRLSR